MLLENTIPYSKPNACLCNWASTLILMFATPALLQKGQAG